MICHNIISQTIQRFNVIEKVKVTGFLLSGTINVSYTRVYIVKLCRIIKSSMTLPYFLSTHGLVKYAFDF